MLVLSIFSCVFIHGQVITGHNIVILGRRLKMTQNKPEHSRNVIRVISGLGLGDVVTLFSEKLLPRYCFVEYKEVDAAQVRFSKFDGWPLGILQTLHDIDSVNIVCQDRMMFKRS